MRIMKKTLLLLGFVLTAIVANAQSFKDAVSGNAPLLKTTSANNTAAPADRAEGSQQGFDAQTERA